MPPARAFAVLGSRVSRELFGGANPLGRRIRIGGERYRTIGVMAAKGQMLGFDLDDAVYIPASRALAMFNRESLMEIDVLFAAGSNADKISAPDQIRFGVPPRQRRFHDRYPDPDA
jgi:putative ABC transport system permease protein